MQESATNGYMPAFVYYNMLQSSGPSGGSEAGNDLAHLASPATMQAYYADWALLMHKIGAFGKPVLVIVEPDLWGYIEQAAARAGTESSGASISASVAKLRVRRCLAGFPDTCSRASRSLSCTSATSMRETQCWRCTPRCGAPGLILTQDTRRPPST